MERVVKITNKTELANAKDDLKYWLSRTPQERFAAVEFLRSQMYETVPRLQRVLRVVQCQGAIYFFE